MNTALFKSPPGLGVRRPCGALGWCETLARRLHLRPLRSCSSKSGTGLPHSKTLPRSPGVPPNCRHVLECAAPTELPSQQRLEIIRHPHLIHLETVDALHLRRRRRAFKPRCRAPRVMVGHRHQTMFHWILMHVVQTRQIRALIGQALVPIVVPHLTVRRTVQAIHPPPGFGVRRRCGAFRRRATWVLASSTAAFRFIPKRDRAPALQCASASYSR